jgi:hypothetical protein
MRSTKDKRFFTNTDTSDPIHTKYNVLDLTKEPTGTDLENLIVAKCDDHKIAKLIASSLRRLNRKGKING